MMNFNQPEPLAPSTSTSFVNAQLGVIGSTAEAVLVNSLAGSGKSTMLAELAFSPAVKNSLYLAFNREIVSDIRGTLPESCLCSTIHAYGLSLIRQRQPKIRVDFYKYGRNAPYKKRNLVNNLIGFHQSRLGLDSYEDMAITANMFCISHNIVPAAMSAWREHRGNHEVVSAGDMIAIPLNMGYGYNSNYNKHYDLTLVDEAADLSRDKLALIQTIDTERIVFCADRNQAIYPFLGSDPDIFDLISTAYNPELHDCNQTFRCPSQIIDVAKRFVPDFWGTKTGGGVSSLRTTEMDGSASIPENALVVCRANAPLLEIANKLIQDKREFRIGRQHMTRIASKLKSTVKLLKNPTIQSMSDQIVMDYDKKAKNFRKNGWSTHSLKDNMNTLLAIVNVGSTLQEAGDYLKKLQHSSSNNIGPRLSTVHSSKGLQSENLFILKPEIGAAIAKKSEPWERVIELSMIPYVATTRSLNHLTYLR